MRRFGKVGAGIRIITAAGLTVGLTLIGTGATSEAAVPGEACIFNAPDGAAGFGHVGWGFKADTGDSWTFGATEDQGASPLHLGGSGAKAASSSWHNSGTYAQMLSAFALGVLVDGQTGTRYSDPVGYYRRYRCSLISSSFPQQATSEIADVETSGYDFLLDNCLTKAVKILTSYGFPGLSSGQVTKPDDYFLSKLPNPTASTPGFSGPQYFTTLTIGVQIQDPRDHEYLNTNPVDKQRPLTVQIYDPDGALVYNPGVVGMATVDANTDRYQITIQLPTDVPAHENVWSTGSDAEGYRVRVKLNYTLYSYVPGFVDILQSEHTTAPDAILTTGDINGDDQVNIADYDILVRCFDDTAPLQGQCVGADVDDDGQVGLFDYNEMIRIFASQEGL